MNPHLKNKHFYELILINNSYVINTIIPNILICNKYDNVSECVCINKWIICIDGCKLF